MPKLAANFSTMFGDVEMLDRFEVAAHIGFRGAEIQNPYGQTSEEVAEAYRDSGLDAVLFNMAPGVGAVPGREADFEAGFTRALVYARGVRVRTDSLFGRANRRLTGGGHLRLEPATCVGPGPPGGGSAAGGAAQHAGQPRLLLDRVGAGASYYRSGG